MPDGTDPAATAQAIIDQGAYMVLATADEDGTPWASPVWYAPDGHARFLWVSRPEARHSRNIASRPQLGIVIFDSHAPIGTGQGVYVEAVAAEVPETELEPAIVVFSQRSQAQGGEEWTAADARPPAPHRLYRATPSRHFLGVRDQRVPVSLG
jgi:nitroimidazol reductase NimA-like FMN-containing flavoprotein (pyridoxamine 5'-phosphate oxidase superfamily)